MVLPLASVMILQAYLMCFSNSIHMYSKRTAQFPPRELRPWYGSRLTARDLELPGADLEQARLIVPPTGLGEIASEEMSSALFVVHAGLRQ